MAVKDSKAAKDLKKDHLEKDHPDLRFFNLAPSDLEPSLDPSDLRQSRLSPSDLPSPVSPFPVSHHAVEFTQTQADRMLLEAIETALTSGTYGSFSELCKQALQQLLLSTQGSVAEGQSSLQVIALQQQVMDLQRQVGKLEGVMSMQRLMSLQQLEQKLEQQMMQLDQRIAHHTTDLNQRIDRLESIGDTTRMTGGMATLPQSYTDLSSNLSADLSSELPFPEPDPIDPLLNRLVPLLEDF
ncbi:MAG TPA: hypothetical protein V6C65_07250 [Allocoleopsis sp.]